MAKPTLHSLGTRFGKIVKKWEENGISGEDVNGIILNHTRDSGQHQTTMMAHFLTKKSIQSVEILFLAPVFDGAIVRVNALGQQNGNNIKKK